MHLIASEPETPGLPAAWAHTFAATFLSALGSHGLTELRPFTGWPPTAPGVERALREWTASAVDALPTKLLNDSDVELAFRVRAALEASISPRVAPSPDVREPLPQAWLDQLVQLLNVPIPAPLDVSDTLRLVSQVRFGALDGERAVQVAGRCLVVDETYPRRLLESRRSPDTKLALLCLYVVHEALHVDQRIDGMDRVTRLRQTGHEAALLHLDLSADRLAVRIVSAAFPRWAQDWLCDELGRSVADFATGPLHTFGSRQRKAARLVGLRLDHLLRPTGRIPGEAHVYPAFGPTQGPFFAMYGGVPQRVLHEGDVTAEQVRALTTALDPPAESGPPHDPIEEVDRVLAELLRGRA